jgi:hypothetical protein
MLRIHEPLHDRLGVQHHPAAGYVVRRNPVKIGILGSDKNEGRSGTSSFLARAILRMTALITR